MNKTKAPMLSEFSNMCLSEITTTSTYNHHIFLWQNSDFEIFSSVWLKHQKQRADCILLNFRDVCQHQIETIFRPYKYTKWNQMFTEMFFFFSETFPIWKVYFKSLTFKNIRVTFISTTRIKETKILHFLYQIEQCKILCVYFCMLHLIKTNFEIHVMFILKGLYQPLEQ